MANEMDSRERLAREACRIEEDSLYSSKGHFEAAELWGRVHLWLGLPTAILAAAATVLAFADLGILAGIISLVVVTSTALITFLNPSQQRNLHQVAGNRFHRLRSAARLFREVDLLGDCPVSELVDRLRSFRGEYEEARAAAPAIPRWAYKRAKRGIEQGEATYVVDSGQASSSSPQ